jgi:uroporphyrinogen-III synthase
LGVHQNVGFDKFPKQGNFLNKKVKVCFNYDTSKPLKGKVIRDDIEEPYQTLIQLEDGRVLRSTECQYSSI